MPDDFEIKGAGALANLGKVLKSAANGKELRKEVLRNFRIAGKPVIGAIQSNLGDNLPRKGGLAARMSKSKVAIRNRLSGQNSGIRLDVKHSQYDLPAINRGRLRHKVFGHKPWVNQSVTPNLVDEAVDKHKPQMQTAVADAMEAVFNQIERSA